jgi:hypothetical protein
VTGRQLLRLLKVLIGLDGVLLSLAQVVPNHLQVLSLLQRQVLRG